MFHEEDGDSFWAMNTQLVKIVHIINQVNNVSHGSEGKEYDIDLETYLHIYLFFLVNNACKIFFFFFEFKAHVRSAYTCRLQYTVVVIYVTLTAVQICCSMHCRLGKMIPNHWDRLREMMHFKFNFTAEELLNGDCLTCSRSQGKLG